MIWNFEAKIFAEVKLGTSLKFGTSAKVSSGQVLEFEEILIRLMHYLIRLVINKNKGTH